MCDQIEILFWIKINLEQIKYYISPIFTFILTVLIKWVELKFL